MVSPILANIYLHELDEFMQEETKAFNRGTQRRTNPEHVRVTKSIAYRRRKVRALGEGGKGTPEREKLIAEIKDLTNTMRTLDSRDHMDPDYRRLNYVRYADDFLIGVIGSRADAVAVLDRVRDFLKTTLLLDVSEEKTGIVKATDGARFLGYDIRTKDGTRIAKIRGDGFVFTKRCSSERVILQIPWQKLQGFCNKHGYGDYAAAKGRHRGGLIHSSDYEIVSIFNAELRGFCNYYRLDNWVKSRVNQLAWVAQQSLVRTLALKHNTSTGAVLKRTRQANGRHVVTHNGRNGRALKVAVWLPKDIRDVGTASPNADGVPLGAALAKNRTDITDRLLAGECENVLCTSPPGTAIQVHHVRALVDVGKSAFV